jgi:hypothetical protein
MRAQRLRLNVTKGSIIKNATQFIQKLPKTEQQRPLPRRDMGGLASRFWFALISPWLLGT